MAVFTYANLKNLVFDRIGGNVSTDAPVSDTEFARYINEAYSDLWEIEGGSTKLVASATAWTAANSATGTVVGILTDIKEITHVWASTTSGSTGTSTGDVELNKQPMSYILSLRASGTGYGTHSVPQMYATTRVATTTPASVGLLRLEYWPSVTGFYFPIAYVPQLTEIDSATVTTPDLTDVGSRDMGLLAAARLAPLIGRPELVPSIMADISQRTQLALKRKREAVAAGDQDAGGRG